MARKIQAPGIEVNEIDFSQYADTTDNSIVDTNVLVMGFSDKGMDYATKYVNSMNTYKKMFGNPTTEAETYLYNAANEIITKGGNVYVAKLPYDNDVLDKYAYVDYTLKDELKYLSSTYDILTNINIQIDEHKNISLYDILYYPSISVDNLAILQTETGKNILTEEELLLMIETGGTLNILNFLNYYKISLPSVHDFVFELLENFEEDYVKLIDEIFYDSSLNKYRNDSIHILSSFYSDYTELSNYGIPTDFIINNEIQLIKLQKKLSYLGTIDELLKEQVRKKTLRYYKTIIHQLMSDIDYLIISITDEYSTIQKNIIQKLIFNYVDSKLLEIKYSELKELDNTLTSYLEVTSNDINHSGLISMDEFDNLKTKQKKVNQNTIRIVDITRSKYESEYGAKKSDPKEYLGLLPVITTPINAIYYQGLIQNTEEDFRDYNALSKIQNINSSNKNRFGEDIQCTLEGLSNASDKNVGFIKNLGSEPSVTVNEITTSKEAASLFPNIQIINDKIDKKHLKDIGVVLFKMEIDKTQDYKILLTPIESYVGSLNKKEIDPVTKENRFIDNIINEKSSRINIFSNVIFQNNANTPLSNIDKSSTFIIANQQATSLGFYSKDCYKQISLQKSIYNAMDRIFDSNTDINRLEIDLIVDAGVSNIAQFINQVYSETNTGYFDFDVDNAYLFKLNDKQNASAWSFVLNKFDNFCKNIRKDCMFIADGLRSLCLIGDQKVVRNTKPTNTIDNTIIKNQKYITGVINSSYSAGYLDWFYAINSYDGSLFWCPPSIKASGIYIYTDAYSYYWNAPAGLNRGKLDNSVIDIAFSPTINQAGIIYNNCWNYAVNYPIDGIVLEGQKTFQRDKTAFDRVNVRRLFLGLERSVRYIAKYFKYDGITDYMMSRFVDSITPVFENAKDKGGLSEYFIICDRRNNTSQTIDNNELHCTIGIRPIKSLEFLVLNFICTNQSVNVQEVTEGFIN